MYRIYITLFLLYLAPNLLFAQSDSLHEIKGIPTKQIFDLMIDRKGFLWVGHDLGLSRFDGTSFTHFSNAQQTSLAVGDLIEDNQGRIWCRSFSSQIFYIQNEKMNLLASYEAKNEPRFPRMVIIGNKLIANSSRGLFVCNTSDLQSSYIKCGNGTSINSISVVNNKIIAYGEGKWYCYDPNGNSDINQLTLVQGHQKLDSIFLQPYGYKDTIYSFSILTGYITKLLVIENKLRIVGKIKTGGFMNTINPSGDDTWIHTKKESITIDGSKKISGYDLTDLVVDKEGNTWYSSFKYGLLIKYKNYWEKIKIIDLDKQDFITHLDVQNNINLYGTNMGEIILENSTSGKIIRRFTLPSNAGPIECVKANDSSRFIISSSLRIYMLKDDLKNLENISSGLTLKDAAFADTSIFLATATGLYELINNPDKSSKNHYKIRLVNNQRCRDIAYDGNMKTLMVAFKDTLFEVQNKQLIPILYKGSQINAKTVEFLDGKFYIATFVQGIFKADPSGVKKINVLDEYKLNTVFRIKLFKDRVWMLGPGFIEIFDPKTEKPYHDIVIPPFPNADIYDIAFIHDQIVLLTSAGSYALRSLNSSSAYKVKNYLMKVSVSGIDSSINDNIVLPFNKNNIEFFLSVPFYTNPDKIYFKYRLKGSIEEDWKISENMERVFRYSSLRPGKYKFEAIAIHPQFGTAEKPISFEFKILAPWYETLLFKVLVVLFDSFIIFMFVRMFFKTRLKQQKINFERKLAIQSERQRISAEIHDDIGAGLSGVRLLTELTGKKIADKETQEEVNKIYSSITDLSSKMREVIWSLNTSNDKLENLLLYIQRQAKQLLENSNIKLSVNSPDNIPAIDMGSEKRTDIYLSVKEALHNALKHSDAENIDLHFKIENNCLYISVSDNGKGIKESLACDGNGMLNMKKRMSRLGGIIDVKSNNGTTIIFSVPLK